MKRNGIKRFLVIFIALAIGFVLAGCASSPAETKEPEPVTGPNESIISIQRKKTMAAAAVSMKVWIDDVEVASSIRNGQEHKLVVANGEYVIQAGSNAVDKGDAVTFSVTGEKITFFAEPQFGLLAARFKLTQTEKRKL